MWVCAAPKLPQKSCSVDLLVGWCHQTNPHLPLYPTLLRKPFPLVNTMMPYCTTCSMLQGSLSWSNWFCHGRTVDAKSYLYFEVRSELTRRWQQHRLWCVSILAVIVMESCHAQLLLWAEIFVYKMYSWVDEYSGNSLLQITYISSGPGWSCLVLVVWGSEFLPKFKVIWGSNLMLSPS